MTNLEVITIQQELNAMLESNDFSRLYAKLKEVYTFYISKNLEAPDAFIAIHKLALAKEVLAEKVNQ